MITKQEAAKAAMEFLKGHSVGILATTNSGGQPFASPVYYAVLPDFSIYFLTSHATHKFKNIVLNNQVAFCVGTGPLYTVVNIHGVATLADESEREKGLQLINDIVGAPMATWPVKAVTSLEQGGVALFKITPKQISYLNLLSRDQLQEIVKYVYEIFP